MLGSFIERPKDWKEEAQVAPDFQPLASSAVTRQRGRGDGASAIGTLPTIVVPKLGSYETQAFYFLHFQVVAAVAPKQKTVKDITSRLPFSQSPSS